MFFRNLIILCLIIFSSTVYAATYWGSIYVDQSTGSTGYSFDYSEEKVAIKEALKNCQKQSSKRKCDHIATWSNGCGAVAWSPKNKSARSGIADSSLDLAKKNALKRCRQIEGDSGCMIIQALCTSWDTEEVIWW
ncbi:MAG: DUF4189 domain-containing protein [Psychrobacter sp.]|nr:DUF4189 domain-containing protein [Psychrobacter sp.]